MERATPVVLRVRRLVAGQHRTDAGGVLYGLPHFGRELLSDPRLSSGGELGFVPGVARGVAARRYCVVEGVGDSGGLTVRGSGATAVEL